MPAFRVTQTVNVQNIAIYCKTGGKYSANKKRRGEDSNLRKGLYPFDGLANLVPYSFKPFSHMQLDQITSY